MFGTNNLKFNYAVSVAQKRFFSTIPTYLLKNFSKTVLEDPNLFFEEFQQVFNPNTNNNANNIQNSVATDSGNHAKLQSQPSKIQFLSNSNSNINNSSPAQLNLSQTKQLAVNESDTPSNEKNFQQMLEDLRSYNEQLEVLLKKKDEFNSQSNLIKSLFGLFFVPTSNTMNGASGYSAHKFIETITFNLQSLKNSEKVPKEVLAELSKTEKLMQDVFSFLNNLKLENEKQAHSNPTAKKPKEQQKPTATPAAAGPTTVYLGSVPQAPIFVEDAFASTRFQKFMKKSNIFLNNIYLSLMISVLLFLTLVVFTLLKDSVIVYGSGKKNGKKKNTINEDSSSSNVVSNIVGNYGHVRPINIEKDKNGKEVLSKKKVKEFADVKGVDEMLDEIKLVVEFLKNPREFSHVGAKLPRGILLVGQPGTGKTLVAKAIAGEANVPFFYMSGAEFDEIFVGVGAGRVKGLFNSARKYAKKYGSCIIFIDEIDSLGGKRMKVTHGKGNQTINQLLAEMDGFQNQKNEKNENSGIIILGATNFPEALDSALMRPGRFDKIIQVPLPNLKGRKDILGLYLKEKIEKNVLDLNSVNIESLAKRTTGMSGADLENLVNEAAINAVIKRRQKIAVEEARLNAISNSNNQAANATTPHTPETESKDPNAPSSQPQKDKDSLGNTINLIPASLSLEQIKIDGSDFEVAYDRVVLGIEQKGLPVTDEDKKRTSIHECGHVLARLYSTLGSSQKRVLHKVSIVPRGNALGVTFNLPNEERLQHTTKNDLLVEIESCLGGRAAEEVMFGQGEVATGGRSDLKKASKLARTIVMTGMGQTGKRDFGEEFNFLSDETKNKIDHEVDSIISQAYANVKKIISSKKRELEMLADYLLEKEILTGDQINLFLEKVPLTPKTTDYKGISVLLSGENNANNASSNSSSSPSNAGGNNGNNGSGNNSTNGSTSSSGVLVGSNNNNKDNNENYLDDYVVDISSLNFAKE